MAKHIEHLSTIGKFLVCGLMVLAFWSPVVIGAQSGEPALQEKSQPLAPGSAGIKAEEFIRYFDAMLQSQKLTPEAAGFFQGIKGIMEGAAKGQDPQTLREKSSGLLQGMKPLMEKPDMPPEAAKMFKSFSDLTQSGSAQPKPEEFLQQFDKLIRGNKLPPEAAGIFQGMRGLMQDAAKGQDPQALKEKSRGLLQGAKPLMEKPDLPPEVSEMFKSFQGMMQKAPTDKPSN
jgi:hypothetical protein